MIGEAGLREMIADQAELHGLMELIDPISLAQLIEIAAHICREELEVAFQEGWVRGRAAAGDCADCVVVI